MPFSDPARFSLAHGGKDSHPYPVPLKVYDETIRVLKSAVLKAKLGQDEELGAVRRLDEESRRLERFAKGPSVEAMIVDERARSQNMVAAACSDGSPRRSTRTKTPAEGWGDWHNPMSVPTSIFAFIFAMAATSLRTPDPRGCCVHVQQRFAWPGVPLHLLSPKRQS